MILFVLLFTVVLTLYRDGNEIFHSEKDALILEVFAQTDLSPESYTVLDEQLRNMKGVKEVVSVSPEESLKKMAGEQKLPIDFQWLLKKSDELKGKNTILPWTYRIYLSEWGELFLRETVNTIQNLEVGVPPRKAVARVSYDKERWSLVYALLNYVHWLWAVLLVVSTCVFGFLTLFFVKWLKWIQSDTEISARLWSNRKLWWREIWSISVIGIVCGLASHFFYLFILSLSFFSDTLYWWTRFGDFMMIQIGLAMLISFLIYGYYLFEGKTNA